MENCGKIQGPFQGAFEIEYTDLSSIELKNVPLSVSRDIFEEAPKLFQDNESIIKVSVATYFTKNAKKPNETAIVKLDKKIFSTSFSKKRCYKYKAFKV